MARFTDRPVVEVSTYVEAPPPVLWGLVSDINVPARFQDEFVGAEWIDGDADTGIGAAFVGSNERQGHQWQTTSWVVAHTPEREFGWAVSDRDNPGAVWTFRLEPRGAGTLLTFHRSLGPGPSGLTRAIENHPNREEELIARRDAEHRANMESVIAGIKRLAEGGER